MHKQKSLAGRKLGVRYLTVVVVCALLGVELRFRGFSSTKMENNIYLRLWCQTQSNYVAKLHLVYSRNKSISLIAIT